MKCRYTRLCFFRNCFHVNICREWICLLPPVHPQCILCLSHSYFYQNFYSYNEIESLECLSFFPKNVFLKTLTLSFPLWPLCDVLKSIHPMTSPWVSPEQKSVKTLWVQEVTMCHWHPHNQVKHLDCKQDPLRLKWKRKKTLLEKSRSSGFSR